jgi:hypothetical protein
MVKKNILIILLLLALFLTWHLRYLKGISDGGKEDFQDYVHEKIDKGQEFIVNTATGLVKVYPLKASNNWNYRRMKRCTWGG